MTDARYQIAVDGQPRSNRSRLVFCQKCWLTLRFRAHEVLLYRGKTFAERSGLCPAAGASLLRSAFPRPDFVI